MYVKKNPKIFIIFWDYFCISWTAKKKSNVLTEFSGKITKKSRMVTRCVFIDKNPHIRYFIVQVHIVQN